MTQIDQSVPMSVVRVPLSPERHEASDAAFRTVRASVLERDGRTCRHCGFHDPAGTYMNVHRLDHDHANNAPSNLGVACTHCHAPNHMDLWTDEEASVAWLPELTQAQVSALCRAMLAGRAAATAAAQGRGYVTSGSDDGAGIADAMGLEASADIVEAALRRRKLAAEERIGTSSPREVALCLKAMPDEAYADRARLLDGFRLVLWPGAQGRRAVVVASAAERWIAPGGAYAEAAPGAR